MPFKRAASAFDPSRTSCHTNTERFHPPSPDHSRYGWGGRTLLGTSGLVSKKRLLASLISDGTHVEATLHHDDTADHRSQSLYIANPEVCTGLRTPVWREVEARRSVFTLWYIAKRRARIQFDR